jgi:hypothetical protein
MVRELVFRAQDLQMFGKDKQDNFVFRRMGASGL